MDHQWIIHQLHLNQKVFQAHFEGISKEEYLWKSAPEKWNLLDLVCHLYDEERDDFRYRVLHCLGKPNEALPPFNPEAWVIERKYAEQDYHQKLAAFLEEREASVKTLRALVKPNWASAVQHPKMGPLSAEFFLANWLEHDYLHLRQLLRIRHLYLQKHSGMDLRYAGDW